jgi:WD40 repeat protein
MVRNHQQRYNRRVRFTHQARRAAALSIAGLLAWGLMIAAQHQPAKYLSITQIFTVASWSADAFDEATIATNSSLNDYFKPLGGTSTASTIGPPPDISGRTRKPPQPPQGPLLSVDYSRDGSRIVTAGLDWTVRQWEANSGREIGRPLRGHQGSVRSAAYSADGSRIVSAGEDGTVRQWEAKSGRAIGEPLRGHQGWVFSAAYSADGSRIVSAGVDGTVRQWEAKSGRAIGEPLRGHPGWVLSAAYSNDGELIVSAGDDGTVRQWEAKSGRAIGEPLQVLM